MKKDEIKELVELRSFLIGEYQGLDGRTSPGTAIIKQTSVASVYEKAIRTLDRILAEHVKFK